MTDTTDNNEQQERLYVDRFKSVEALEDGYKELEKAFSQKSQYESKYNEVKDFKEKFEELSSKTAIPDEYTAKGVLLEVEESELRALAEEAKGYGLNQDNFEKWASKRIEDAKQNKKETVEVNDDLKKYLSENVGLSDNLINSFDAKDLEHFEERRQQSLNSDTSVTGGATGGAITAERKRELYNEFKAVEKMGGRAAQEAWDKYQNAIQTLRG